MNKHPIQPIYTDDKGTKRFKPNAIVQFLLETSRFNMNDIFVMDFLKEDREQFAQLIGYSLSGFSELSYVSDETYEAAVAMSEGEGSAESARNQHLRDLLNELRSSLREPMARLFGVHPDDIDNPDAYQDWKTKE